jgi:hypothetical protein
MTIERKVSWIFASNAVINWLVSVRGILDPVGTTLGFGGAAPNYPFVIRLWSAFIFMFGCMFWEVSRDPRGKRALLKYNWIEKTLTATAVTLGFTSGEAPPRLMLLVLFTNWLWIPLILWADVALQRGRPRSCPLPVGSSGS